MPERPTRSTLKRAEILRSAAAAFRRRGFHGASMGGIARTLHMTKGNLYYYFRNKEEILFFCHDYSVGVLLNVLREVEAERRPPDEKLRRLITAFVRMLIDELQGTLITLDLLDLSPALRRRTITKRDRFERGIRRIIKEGMDRGIFGPGDPKLLTFAILGAVNWITRWFDPEGPAHSEQIGRVFADYLVSGLLRSRRERAAS